jgi:hypothetical protein
MDQLQALGKSSEPVRARVNEIKKQLSQLSGPAYFPLNNNPFIHHAMNFLWDPDFVVFMREAVVVQQRRMQKVIDRDASNEQMNRLMNHIYPKLEMYLNYLYGRTDYPHIMRNARLLSDEKI